MNATKSKTAQIIASDSMSANRTSLYFSQWTLMRQGNRYWLSHRCGAAIRSQANRYQTREDSIDWLASEAIDPVTGYGYTYEQAVLMIEGIDAGRGYRDLD